MNHHFTADLHIGHEKVAKIRGYDDTASHDSAILENLLQHTKPGDNIWILGDLTVGREVDETIALLLLDTMLPDRDLHLIVGNHDTTHPMRSKAHKKLHTWNQVFTSIQSAASLKIAGQRALLSHYPYDSDYTDGDRFTQWRLQDMGMPIIHGHTHATEPISHSTTGTLQICVSLDAWDMKPASKDTLTHLIQENTK